MLYRALVAPGVSEPKEAKSGKVVARKGVVERCSCPYRNPTQVDEEKILRPAGEGVLRN